MVKTQTVDTLKTLLNISDSSQDGMLSVYLDLAEREILNFRYSMCGGVPEDINSIPDSDVPTQIFAVIAGFNQQGVEGQSVSIENGIHRHFVYEDMLGYIHNHIVPYAGVC